MIVMLRIATRVSLLAVLVSACSLSPDLPTTPIALADMEEPLDLRAEPNDESQRLALPLGTFSGLYLSDARETLAAKLNSPDSVQVARVVEHSPADHAGIRTGDLILEVEVDGGEPQTLSRPSEWRKVELDSKPGAKVVMFIDRAGREARTEFTLIKRLRAPKRDQSERYREEQRIGVVIRTATEVEARTAGLAPGAGAVIVGLSARSPWRLAGIRFQDLLISVNGQPIHHPQELLTAVRDTANDSLNVTYMRNGKPHTVKLGMTHRKQETTEVSLPLLFSYEVARGRTEWSFLLGILNYRSTAAAWRFRVLWLIGFGGGDSDQLLELKA